MEWLLVISTLLGTNYSLWGLVGAGRLIKLKLNRLQGVKKVDRSPDDHGISIDKVAALIPAHNESLVIGDTLESLKKILPSKQIYVVSDGSSDSTSQIAHLAGVCVFDSAVAHGKAGALELGLKHFDLLDKYQAVMLVDADTLVNKNYLNRGLKYFSNPRVVAIAGYARTLWQPQAQGWWSSFLLLYRDRAYTLTQTLLKFGQTSTSLNVSPIIPGFASIYRTSVLRQIDINPPGLVIEDFNMTFAIHHQRLGLIAHHPQIYANTQDPSTLDDYIKQVRRWNLGFWQTVRLHGVRLDLFNTALILLMIEVVVSSAVLLMVPIFVAILALPIITNGLILNYLPFFIIHNALVSQLTLGKILALVVLPDYLLSVVTAIVKKRPQYLIYGVGFIVMRFVDAALMLGAIPRALLSSSTGHWRSPARRSIATPQLVTL